jgi:hypothetical protein
MRLVGFAAGCAAIAVMPGCSLAAQGLGPEDGTSDDAGEDARATATFDALAPLDGTSPDDAVAVQGAPDGPWPGPLEAGNPSLCASAGLAFCDGFENGAGAWMTQTNGGSIAIESGRAYRGAFALHARQDAVTTNDGPRRTALFSHSPPQAWPLQTFVRMFVYLPPPVPQSIGALVDILESSSPYEGIQLNIRPPNGFFGGTAYNGLDTDWSSSTDLLATDAWTCVEMEIDGPPANVVHIFVAGAELPAMERALPHDVPPLGDLQVGLSYFQANEQPQTDLWIDEVAVDTSRVGCVR